jgi:hypothetical protein
LIKNYINGTLKTRVADPPKKAAPPLDDDDGDDAGVGTRVKTTRST